MSKLKSSIMTSKFIYYLESNDEHFILHTLNWKIYRLSKNLFISLKNKDFNLIPESIMQKLLQEQIICDASINENAYMLHHLAEARYDNVLRITIIPTESCNFKCVYCYQSHNDNHMSESVESSVVNFFKRYTKSCSAINIEWFGGEPLLRAETVINISRKIKEFAREYGKPVIASMTTNGYLLDLDTFDCLVSNNVLYYQITLDGFASEHDKNRPLASGEGSYEKIISNLLRIRDHSTRKYFVIAIRINISKDNLSTIDSFLAYLSENFGNDKRFSIIIDTIKDWGGESVKQITDSLLPNHQHLGSIIPNNPSGVNYFSDFFESTANRICHASKRDGYVINYNGEILKCAKAALEGEATRKMNYIGILSESGGVVLDKLKISQWLCFPKPYPKCDDCLWLPACISMHCPLRDIINLPARCLLNDLSKGSIDLSILEAAKKNKVIRIGEGV